MHGNRLFSSKDGLRKIIAALKDQETVGILLDHNTVPGQGIFVDFLINRCAPFERTCDAQEHIRINTAKF